MGQLSGKVAVVTGAGSGIGQAQANLFLREGAKVALLDRAAIEPDTFAGFGQNAVALEADVSSTADWRVAVGEVVSRFGDIDILVNTAGVAILRPIAETTAEEFTTMFEVNQLGVFLGIKHVTSSMRTAGGGSIINIASGAGLRGLANMSCYAATKWAVRGLTRSAAIELGPDKIRVNSIFPGPIDTPMLALNSAETNERLLSRNPSGRKGHPSEIAAATLFLASDASSYVSGAELAVDGGSSA